MKLLLVLAGVCLAVVGVSALTNRELYDMLSATEQQEQEVEYERSELEVPSEDEEEVDVIDLPGGDNDEVDLDALMSRLKEIDCGLGCHHRRWWWWRHHRHYRVCGHCRCYSRSCYCNFRYRVRFHTGRWISIRLHVRTILVGWRRVRVKIYFNGRCIYHRICAMDKSQCIQFPGMNASTCFNLYRQEPTDNEVCSTITGKYSHQGQEQEIVLRDTCLPIEAPRNEQ